MCMTVENDIQLGFGFGFGLLLICWYFCLCGFEGWNLHIEHGFTPRKTLPVCGILRNSAGISVQPLELPNGRSSLSLYLHLCLPLPAVDLACTVVIH
jgi:hypothetical protein